MNAWRLKRAPQSEAAGSDQPQAGQEVRLSPAASSFAVSDKLLALKVLIHQELLEKVNLSALDSMPREQIAREVSDIIGALLDERGEVLNRAERTILSNDVLDELLGLGPLEPLLKDDSINDILVNGYQTVFVERAGVLEKVSTRFQDEKHLLRIIQKIVSAVGRRVDESSPFVDARLQDGSRVNAIVSPWRSMDRCCRSASFPRSRSAWSA
jgi:pilus assembly protein CpaF